MEIPDYTDTILSVSLSSLTLPPEKPGECQFRSMAYFLGYFYSFLIFLKNPTISYASGGLLPGNRPLRSSRKISWS
jgi:hypothetical protein